MNPTLWNFVTRKPPSPRAYCRARGIGLILYRHRRGGWQALALGSRSEILTIAAQRGPKGVFEVWCRGESLRYAALFCAVVIRSPGAELVSRRRLSAVLLEAESRLAAMEKPPTPQVPPQPRWRWQ